MPTPSYVAARSNMVRVDFAQLDHLLNLVGELIIYRTKLQQVGRETGPSAWAAARRAASCWRPSSRWPGSPPSSRRRSWTSGCCPSGHVFERFPRLVRDLARQQGKDMELILEGEDTRVDKAIIDEIGEPLVHMIRNSVDHGIEPPDVRVARGKTPTGTILLSAAQESNHVRHHHHGRRRRASTPRSVRQEGGRRSGLLRADETLSDRDAVQLIFAEGFSTAAQPSPSSPGAGWASTWC